MNTGQRRWLLPLASLACCLALQCLCLAGARVRTAGHVLWSGLRQVILTIRVVFAIMALIMAKIPLSINLAVFWFFLFTALSSLQTPILISSIEQYFSPHPTYVTFPFLRPSETNTPTSSCIAGATHHETAKASVFSYCRINKQPKITELTILMQLMTMFYGVGLSGDDHMTSMMRQCLSVIRVLRWCSLSMASEHDAGESLCVYGIVSVWLVTRWNLGEKRWLYNRTKLRSQLEFTPFHGTGSTMWKLCRNVVYGDEMAA